MTKGEHDNSVQVFDGCENQGSYLEWDKEG